MEQLANQPLELRREILVPELDRPERRDSSASGERLKLTRSATATRATDDAAGMEWHPAGGIEHVEIIAQVLVGELPETTAGTRADALEVRSDLLDEL